MSLEQWKSSEYASKVNVNSQFGRVISVMVNNAGWHTLREIEDMIHAKFPDRDTQAAISARLREVNPLKHGLEKEKCMEVVNKKQVWRYRLVPAKKCESQES